jgi:hypothetical protein
MELSKIHKWEKALVLLLNLDGWQLEWTGSNNTRYDAKGITPKGKKCVIEMKFRKKYYQQKLLEADKYNALMQLDSDIVKIYFVADPKGNFMYWLNTLKMPDKILKYCPDTTLWTKKRIQKEVYLLDENLAVRININNYDSK